MKIKINRGHIKPVERDIKINLGSLFSELPAGEEECEDCPHLRRTVEPEGLDIICVGTPTECWRLDSEVKEIEGFLEDNDYLIKHLDFYDTEGK